MKSIVLINMPFAAVERPSLALSILHAQLKAVGCKVHVLYPNIDFAQIIDPRLYHCIANSCDVADLIGEWVFTKSVFNDITQCNSYLNNYLAMRAFSLTALQSYLGTDSKELVFAHLIDAQDQVTDFLDKLELQVLQHNPDIVGATTVFQQTLPSVAILKRIHNSAPRVKTVLGGANCEGCMGVALRALFPWVNTIHSGRIEGSYSDVFDVEWEPECYQAPNFDSYFAKLRSSKLLHAISPGLPFESSTGCWYGEKRHCTFCGLNGEKMAFKSRNGFEVLSELKYQQKRYNISRFQAVDNIIPMQFFKTLLPELAAGIEEFEIFYEIKSNLSEKHIQTLKKAGICWIQPGIESLSSDVLTRLNKGNSAISNIYLLKKAYEFGVRLSWSILIGDPGETEKDYVQSLITMKKITHLQPPSNLVRIRFDRFSPYHVDQVSFGLNLDPFHSYRYVYPLCADLENLAYFFEDYSLSRADITESPAKDLVDCFTNWQHSFYSSSAQRRVARLTFEAPRLIYDSRGASIERIQISDEERTVLDKADGPVLVSVFSERERKVLSDLSIKSLVFEENRKVISLVTREPSVMLPELSEFPGGYFNIWHDTLGRLSLHQSTNHNL